MGEGQSNNHGDRDAPVKVGMISLGCAKNLVDGEIMLGRLLRSGVELTADATLADVVIVNTCGFITDAKKESIDSILEVVHAKQNGRDRTAGSDGWLLRVAWPRHTPTTSYARFPRLTPSLASMS